MLIHQSCTGLNILYKSNGQSKKRFLFTTVHHKKRLVYLTNTYSTPMLSAERVVMSTWRYFNLKYSQCYTETAMPLSWQVYFRYESRCHKEIFTASSWIHFWAFTESYGRISLGQFSWSKIWCKFSSFLPLVGVPGVIVST